MAGILITPLGGVGYVGQNCFLYEFDGHAVVIDCGIKPLGCEKRATSGRDGWGDPPTRLDILDGVLGMGSNAIGIGTHAHLDHIGAVAELAKRGIPVYMSEWSNEFLPRYAENLRMPVGFRPYALANNRIIQLNHGEFEVILVPFPHSIRGAYGVLMRVGGKNILHLSDFKFNGVKDSADETRQTFRDIREISGRIDCLLLDVLNSELPGFTPPEQQVFGSTEAILAEKRGRVVITFFSTNLDRMEGILDIAKKQGLKVRIAGMGMSNSYALLGRRGDNFSRDDWDVLLVSGSQGESRSGLERMARGDPSYSIKLGTGDTALFASRSIPGNETCERAELNALHARGVKIILHHGEAQKLGLDFAVEEMFLHVSGHEQLGGLLEAVNILEPGAVVPIHAPWCRVEFFEQAVGIRVRRVAVGETLEV